MYNKCLPHADCINPILHTENHALTSKTYEAKFYFLDLKKIFLLCFLVNVKLLSVYLGYRLHKNLKLVCLYFSTDIVRRKRTVTNVEIEHVLCSVQCLV
jgi:hypothetical protein